MAKQFDAIIIGSGIGGLSFALNLARYGRSVAVVTKKTSSESNTNWAQGGIACVTDKTDDFMSHVNDTLTAGDGLCELNAVKHIIESGPARVAELIEWGVKFENGSDGNPDLGREGGHSKRRILHARDMTGRAIESALIRAVNLQKNITILEHHLAIDLITLSKIQNSSMNTVEDRVVGIHVLNTKQSKVETLSATVVVLATGGIGQVYQFTTNPDIATGDGIAMAYRAGAEIRDMEMVQFHPTALKSSDGSRALISEAVRGEGAILRDMNGRAFMKDFHPLGDLAPRDVVARAIDSVMKRDGAPHVLLDITKVAQGHLAERFPHIYATCLKAGFDLTKDYIPVVPAAHYLCGGVTTDLSGRTTLPGLYAVGEVASTGLHGANRLASNSLLEAVVLAHDGAAAADNDIKNKVDHNFVLPAWVDGALGDPDERVVLTHNWDELRRTMWDYVGIVRSTKRLKRAQTRIRTLSEEVREYYWNFKVEPRLLELRNLIQVAELIIDCALQRHESRGLHYTLDFPAQSKSIVHSMVRRNLNTK
ncbi:MAG: L-aspartate oxidase [Opitutae bacterium]